MNSCFESLKANPTCNAFFKNKNNFNLLSINKKKDKIWFDLDDVYLVFETSSYLDKKIAEEKFLLGFFENKKLLSSFGFTKWIMKQNLFLVIIPYRVL